LNLLTPDVIRNAAALLFDSGESGIDASTLTWLKAHDIVAIGADNHASEFFIVIAPLRLVGGAGSPINPIAIA
jgi:kynurenine formamidase